MFKNHVFLSIRPNCIEFLSLHLWLIMYLSFIQLHMFQTKVQCIFRNYPDILKQNDFEIFPEQYNKMSDSSLTTAKPSNCWHGCCLFWKCLVVEMSWQIYQFFGHINYKVKCIKHLKKIIFHNLKVFWAIMRNLHFFYFSSVP